MFYTSYFLIIIVIRISLTSNRCLVSIVTLHLQILLKTTHLIMSHFEETLMVDTTLEILRNVSENICFPSSVLYNIIICITLV